MKASILFGLLLLSVTITGCVSSNFTYKPPLSKPKIENTISVNENKEKVWNKLVKKIGANFFVINNMDKQSGFLNVSYSGDPEKYIEGGELSIEFSNLRGDRKYVFPASRAYAQYETLINGSLYMITRQLDLEGRMNILISEIDSSHTSVTVNTRYVLTMNESGIDLQGKSLQPFHQTITFNTGESGKSTGGTQFYSNGELERAILEILN